MSAACAPGTAAAAAKPAEVAIRKPLFPMGHSSCCSECARNTRKKRTGRSVIPPFAFQPYVPQKAHFFPISIVHSDDRRYCYACSDVDGCTERLYQRIL